MSNTKKLTDLEKKVLVDAMSEGFLYDANLRVEERPFLVWGFEGCGRKERGAVSSLVKKGVIIVEDKDEDGLTPVYLKINYTQLCALLGLENPTYRYADIERITY